MTTRRAIARLVFAAALVLHGSAALAVCNQTAASTAGTAL